MFSTENCSIFGFNISFIIEIILELQFWKLGNSLWPKLDELEINAQIALISIVFNRGTSTKGDSRREMRNIKELVIQKDYEGIAQQIISMKRLWVGKNLDGLLKRRDIEAKMVESCI